MGVGKTGIGAKGCKKSEMDKKALEILDAYWVLVDNNVHHKIRVLPPNRKITLLVETTCPKNHEDEVKFDIMVKRGKGEFVEKTVILKNGEQIQVSKIKQIILNDGEKNPVIHQEEKKELRLLFRTDLKFSHDLHELPN